MERLSESAHLPADGPAVHDSAGDAEIHVLERRILFPDYGRRVGDLPVADRFIIGQKSVIEGIALGGVKG